MPEQVLDPVAVANRLLAKRGAAGGARDPVSMADRLRAKAAIPPDPQLAAAEQSLSKRGWFNTAAPSMSSAPPSPEALTGDVLRDIAGKPMPLDDVLPPDASRDELPRVTPTDLGAAELVEERGAQKARKQRLYKEASDAVYRDDPIYKATGLGADEWRRERERQHDFGTLLREGMADPAEWGFGVKPLGEIIQALAMPVVGPVQTTERLIHQQQPGGELFDKSDSAVAGEAGLRGLASGVNTATALAYPGVNLGFAAAAPVVNPVMERISVGPLVTDVTGSEGAGELANAAEMFALFGGADRGMRGAGLRVPRALRALSDERIIQRVAPDTAAGMTLAQQPVDLGGLVAGRPRPAVRGLEPSVRGADVVDPAWQDPMPQWMEDLPPVRMPPVRAEVVKPPEAPEAAPPVPVEPGIRGRIAKKLGMPFDRAVELYIRGGENAGIGDGILKPAEFAEIQAAAAGPRAELPPVPTAQTAPVPPLTPTPRPAPSHPLTIDRVLPQGGDVLEGLAARRDVAAAAEPAPKVAPAPQADPYKHVGGVRPEAPPAPPPVPEPAAPPTPSRLFRAPRPAKPATNIDLVPPPGEGTVPIANERAIAAAGGPEKVAADTGRVVVAQADGTKAIVPPERAVEAQRLANEGKLAEIVNGEGNGVKPAVPTEIVSVPGKRDILTGSSEGTAAAVATNPGAAVIPATPENMAKTLEARADAPAPAPEAPAAPKVETSPSAAPEAPRGVPATAKAVDSVPTATEPGAVDQGAPAADGSLRTEFTRQSVRDLVKSSADSVEVAKRLAADADLTPETRANLAAIAEAAERAKQPAQVKVLAEEKFPPAPGGRDPRVGSYAEGSRTIHLNDEGLLDRRAKWIEEHEGLSADAAVKEALARTFTHEQVHAIDTGAWREGSSIYDLPETVKYRADLTAVWEEFLRRVAGTQHERIYSSTSPMEFIAEARSKPGVQDLLRGMKLEQGGTLWDRLVSTIRSYITRLSGKNVDPTVLDAALSVHESWVEARSKMEPTWERESRGRDRGPRAKDTADFVGEETPPRPREEEQRKLFGGPREVPIVERHPGRVTSRIVPERNAETGAATYRAEVTIPGEAPREIGKFRNVEGARAAVANEVEWHNEQANRPLPEDAGDKSRPEDEPRPARPAKETAEQKLEKLEIPTDIVEAMKKLRGTKAGIEHARRVKEALGIPESVAGKDAPTNPLAQTRDPLIAKDTLRLKLARESDAGVRKNPPMRIKIPERELPLLTGRITPAEKYAQLRRVVESPPDGLTQDWITENTLWYEKAKPALEFLFDGDLELARENIVTWALNNQQVGPAGATLNMLRAIEKELGAPTKHMAGLTESASREYLRSGRLSDGRQGAGQKVHDFSDNLLGVPTRTWMGGHPAGEAPVTMDTWGNRGAGLVDAKLKGHLRDAGADPRLVEKLVEDVNDTGSPGAVHYERSAEFFNEIYAHLVKDGVRPDLFPPKTPDAVKRVQALDWAWTMHQVGIKSQTVADAVARNASFVNVEVDPGKGSILDRRLQDTPWRDRPFEERAKLTGKVVDAFMPETLRAMGVMPTPRPARVRGGGWGASVNPSGQVFMFIDPRSAEQVARAVAYTMSQDGVPWMRFVNSGDVKAMHIAHEALGDPATASAFWQKFEEGVRALTKTGGVYDTRMVSPIDGSEMMTPAQRKTLPKGTEPVRLGQFLEDRLGFSNVSMDPYNVEGARENITYNLGTKPGAKVYDDFEALVSRVADEILQQDAKVDVDWVDAESRYAYNSHSGDPHGEVHLQEASSGRPLAVQGALRGVRERASEALVRLARDPGADISDLVRKREPGPTVGADKRKLFGGPRAADEALPRPEAPGEVGPKPGDAGDAGRIEDEPLRDGLSSTSAAAGGARAPRLTKSQSSKADHAFFLLDEVLLRGENRQPRPTREIIQELEKSPAMDAPQRLALRAVLSLEEPQGVTTRVTEGTLQGEPTAKSGRVKGDRWVTGRYHALDNDVALSGPVMRRMIDREILAGHSPRDAADRAAAKVIAHEYVHAVSVRAFDLAYLLAERRGGKVVKDPIFGEYRINAEAALGADRVKLLDEIESRMSRDQVARLDNAGRELAEIYDEFMQKLSPGSERHVYAATNPREFIAEAMSNPDIQRMLAGSKSMREGAQGLRTERPLLRDVEKPSQFELFPEKYSPKGQSLLHRVARVLLDMLDAWGIPVGAGKTMLEDAFGIGRNLSRVQRELSDAGVFKDLEGLYDGATTSELRGGPGKGDPADASSPAGEPVPERSKRFGGRRESGQALNPFSPDSWKGLSPQMQADTAKAAQRVKRTVPKTELRTFIRNTLDRMGDYARAEAPIRRLEEARDGRVSPTGPTEYAIYQQGAAGKQAETMWEHGQTDSAQLRPVAEAVEKVIKAGQEDKLSLYLVARRALARYQPHGLDSGVDHWWAHNFKKEIEASFPDVVDAANRLNEGDIWLRRRLLRAGGITPQADAAIDAMMPTDNFYAPMERVLDQGGPQGSTTGGGGPLGNSSYRKVTAPGTPADMPPVYDPLVRYFEQYRKMWSRINAAETAKKLAQWHDADPAGAAAAGMREVPPFSGGVMHPSTTTFGQFSVDYLTKNPSASAPEVLDAWEAQLPAGTLQAVVGNKLRSFEFKDPHVMEAMKTLRGGEAWDLATFFKAHGGEKFGPAKDVVDAADKGLRGLSKLKRLTTTGINAAFAATQLLMDVPTWYMMTESKGLFGQPRARDVFVNLPHGYLDGLYNGFREAISGAIDLPETKLSKMYDRAPTEGFYDVNLSRGPRGLNAPRRAFGGLARDPGWTTAKAAAGSVADAVRPIDRLSRLMGGIEGGPRRAEGLAYLDSIGKTVSDPLSLDEFVQLSNRMSKATVPFKLGSKMSKGLSQYEAYHNAGVQAVKMASDVVRQHPGRTAARLLAISVIPTVTLWALNHDKEEYLRSPLYERYGYNTIVGPERLRNNRVWSLPAVALQMALDKLALEDPPTAKELAKQWLSQAWNDAPVPSLPDVPKAAVEIATNHSFFTGQDINPPGMENVEQRAPWLVARRGDPKVMAEVSRIVHDLSASLGIKSEWTTAELSYLAKQFLGPVGTETMKAVDEPVGTPEPADMPIAGRFAKPLSSSIHTQKFWALVPEFDGMAATARLAHKQGDPELSATEKPLKADVKLVNDVRERLRDLREKYRTAPSPDEKRMYAEQMDIEAQRGVETMERALERAAELAK